MPSAYTSVVPIPQGAGNRQYRGYLEATVQDVADSYVRVNYTAYVEMYYAWQYGVGIQVTGGGSATGVLPNAIGPEWVRVPKCVVTGYFTVNKTSSQRTYAVRARAYGVAVDINGNAPGYYYGSAGGSATVSVNVTIPAAYTPPRTYTVSFNANGGNNAPASQTKIHNETLILTTQVPERDGYRCLGWATSSTASSPTYIPGGAYITNASDVLYAVWERITFTITYNAANGTGTTKTQTFNAGDSATIQSNSWSREGYTFAGWSTVRRGSVEYAPNSRYSTNRDVTLYAIWAPSNPYVLFKDQSLYCWEINESSIDGPFIDRYGEITTTTFTEQTGQDLIMADNFLVGSIEEV